MHTLSGHGGLVLDVAFSARGEMVTSSSQDRRIRLWDVTSGQEVQAFRMRSVDMADIDISVDRNLLASGEAIWDLDSMQETLVLERGTRFPGFVAFSPDGSVLALGLLDQRIRLWDVTSGEPVYAFDAQEENRTKRIDFSPDGALLAAGVIDGSIMLWEVESGQLVRTLRYAGETDIHYLEFSPAGNLLASGGRVHAVVLWDVASGQVVRTFGLQDNLISLAFSPDGMILASAGGTDTVLLWDVESGNLLHSLTQNAQVMTVAISPDGRLLAVGCSDNQIYLWGIP
jgi:WD40 repeat protein